MRHAMPNARASWATHSALGFGLRKPGSHPSRWTAVAGAAHAESGALGRRREDLRTLAFDTASAFITAPSTEQLLLAAQQRLQRAQADMDDSAARAQAGLTSTNDLTPSEYRRQARGAIQKS